MSSLGKSIGVLALALSGQRQICSYVHGGLDRTTCACALQTKVSY